MTNYTSVKLICDNVKDHPMLLKVPFERMVNYAVEFMRIIGMPNEFIEKTAVLELDNYRAVLPCDFYEIILVRVNKTPKHFLEGKTLRYSTDSFHMSNEYSISTELTYKLLSNVIYTSLKEGSIEIAYRAIPLDEEGYPLVPDDSAYARALEEYIKKKCFTIRYELGKLDYRILNNVQREYAFYVGLALSNMVKLSLDLAEALSRSINKLLPYTLEHSRGFTSLGNKEHTKNI